MADKPETTEVTPTPEPKLSDSVRDALSADDALPEGEAPATAATTKTPSEEATAATTEALTEALPELTPEQIAVLANDPNMVAAVLSSQDLNIDKILEELYPVVEEQVVKTHKQKAEYEKTVATLSDAIKAAEEEGDFETLGKLLYEKMKAQEAEQALTAEQQKLIDQGRDEAYNDLDTVVEEVWGDVMSAMTPEELAALDRDKFKDESSYMTAVFTALDGKRQEMVLSQRTQETEAEAETVAAAAASARGRVGVGAIPGGSGIESKGESIGDLLRQGLGDALNDESD